MYEKPPGLQLFNSTWFQNLPDLFFPFALPGGPDLFLKSMLLTSQANVAFLICSARLLLTKPPVRFLCSGSSSNFCNKIIVNFLYLK